jgi:hypothetical protein
MSESESNSSQKHQNVTVRVTKETAEQLSEEADERGMSRAQLLRELINSREVLLGSGHASDGDHSSSGRESDVSDEQLTDLREQLTEAREKMHEEREERIRYEERVTLLEREKEQAVGEKNRWQNKYHEANGKLKVHHSERESLPARLKSWLTGE